MPASVVFGQYSMRAEFDRFGGVVWRVYHGTQPIATLTTKRAAGAALKKLRDGNANRIKRGT